MSQPKLKLDAYQQSLIRAALAAKVTHCRLAAEALARQGDDPASMKTMGSHYADLLKKMDQHQRDVANHLASVLDQS